jgi:hypothetical protein
VEVLKNENKINTYYNQINKPSLTVENFGSDRESFICCGCLGNGRVSIIAFLGLTISHLTRILNK